MLETSPSIGRRTTDDGLREPLKPTSRGATGKRGRRRKRIEPGFDAADRIPHRIESSTLTGHPFPGAESHRCDSLGWSELDERRPRSILHPQISRALKERNRRMGRRRPLPDDIAALNHYREKLDFAPASKKPVLLRLNTVFGLTRARAGHQPVQKMPRPIRVRCPGAGYPAPARGDHGPRGGICGVRLPGSRAREDPSRCRQHGGWMGSSGSMGRGSGMGVALSR